MDKNDGFVCPKCKSKTNGRVVESREAFYGRRRRRVCENCGNRYTTIEIYAKNPRRVYKKFMEENGNENQPTRPHNK